MPTTPPTAAIIPIKSKQINVRITDAQAALIKQYCNYNNVGTQEAVMRAMKLLISEF